MVMTSDVAACLLEDVIDTLIEVGNGTTEDHLNEALHKLLRFRDEWFSLKRGEVIASKN